MDLISAKVEAAALSQKNKKKVFIIIDQEGECDLSTTPVKGVAYAFLNGAEVPLSNGSSSPLIEEEIVKPKGEKSAAPSKAGNKSESKMAKKAKAKSAKKTKTPVKKAKANTPEGTGKATTLVLSEAQWHKVDKICDEQNTNIRTMVRDSIIAQFKL